MLRSESVRCKRACDERVGKPVAFGCVQAFKGGSVCSVAFGNVCCCSFASMLLVVGSLSVP
eukprot:4840275-Pleurochrysis_carterae.AAC.1